MAALSRQPEQTGPAGHACLTEQAAARPARTPPRRAPRAATGCPEPHPLRSANARSASATRAAWARAAFTGVRDQRAAPGGRVVDHLTARRGDRDQHGAAVAAGTVPPDQALTRQPVAHPPGGRRRHVQRPRQVHQPARATGRQHHQRPVLRDGGLLRGRAQRPRGDRDHGPAGGQHRVHRGLIRRMLSHHTMPSVIFAICNKCIILP